MSFRRRGEPLTTLNGPRPLATQRKQEPNPTVKPSSVAQASVVSSGCADLDRILRHGGVPVGSSVLVEESGTTDFALVLLRNFAAQGVVHGRLARDKAHSHVVVIGAGDWERDLPGVYELSREQKAKRLAENEKKVSVANLAAERDMKIAWRYGQRPEEKQERGDGTYLSRFDVTTKLVPAAAPTEVTRVAYGPLHQMLAQMELIVRNQQRRNPEIVVRVVVPHLVSPVNAHEQEYVLPLFHGLQALVSRSRAVMMASVPVALYPRTHHVCHFLELVASGVVHLEAFNEGMAALVERAHRNEPQKIQQGFVHIYKVPLLSEQGMMMVQHGEYAFRNGRRQFEIEEWGIPVEDEPEKEDGF